MANCRFRETKPRSLLISPPARKRVRQIRTNQSCETGKYRSPTASEITLDRTSLMAWIAYNRHNREAALRGEDMVRIGALWLLGDVGRRLHWEKPLERNAIDGGGSSRGHQCTGIQSGFNAAGGNEDYVLIVDGNVSYLAPQKLLEIHGLLFEASFGSM
jgi:hypothetical protein